MKKLIFALTALFCFNFTSMATTATAAQRYLVTISVQITYNYYEGNTKIGSNTVMGTPQTIDVWADTPYEAQQKALSECSTMCKQSYKDEGYRQYLGKSYKCTSEKVPYQIISVKPLDY